MMKSYKLIAVLLLVCTLLLGLSACDPTEGPATPSEPSHVDYASQLKLDMSSTSLKEEVTVKLHIDGDTTHFYVNNDFFEDGVVKARYLAINTPESTGRIEPWGKMASNFTKEKLSNATSIIIESDNEKWNADSTGGRYLVWVWYKTADMTEYRNLNLEILQNGLAIASNSAQNRYGNMCMDAINQARQEDLYVYTKERDPSFPYGEAQELTLKELRCNIESYDNAKVAFEGVIVKDDSGSIYVEEYDAETGRYYGMTVYYETAGLPGKALGFLNVGNRVRIVGSVTAFQGSWQVSGLTYSMMKPDHPDNIQKIGEGYAPAYTLITPEEFVNGKITIAVGEENKTYDFHTLALNTSVAMRDLTVIDTYTTKTGDSTGAITLTCKSVDGLTISVRTTVLRDANGDLITEDAFKGKTIDVKGLIDHYTYEGADEWQIKVFSIKDVTIY